jgi:sugar transferase (PEP-CTERM/EpsH1 system associated)
MQSEIKNLSSSEIRAPHTLPGPARRMRVLHFAPRVCWPLDTGAKLRNYHLAKVLSEQASITLLAFSDPEQTFGNLKSFYERVISVPREPGYTISKIARGLLGPTPLPVLNYTTAGMKEALARVLEETDFDLVQIESLHLAAYVPIIRAARHRPKVICDWHNLESELLQRYSQSARSFLRRVYAQRTAAKMSQLERESLAAFDAHVVVSERDAAQLRQMNPQARVSVIQNGVDHDHYFNGRQLRPETSRRILFVGSMDYHANCDGVVEFAREVWPLVRARHPELVFTVVGRDPLPAVRELALLPGVEVTGTVDDVRPYYREALAAIVPLKVGGGSRLKILESMAAGVPVIATALGAEGLDVKPDENILIAEHRDEFCNAIDDVVNHPELSAKLVRKGRELVREQYDWSQLGSNLSALHQAMLTQPPLKVTPRPTLAAEHQHKIKILALVEARNLNAVAKNMLEFHRAAGELHFNKSDVPGVELSLVTFDREPEQPNEFVQTARAQGLDVTVINERRRFDLSVIRALRNIVAEQNPDIVLTHSVKSHFVIWRSAVWKRIPWVAFHHGYTATDRKMLLFNQLDRWSLAHATTVVTVCGSFATELEKQSGIPREKITVRHNSIRREARSAPALVSNLRASLGIEVDERVVLSMGRLSREKAHDDLLRAFKCLADACPDMKVRLVIAGDGPERTRLEATAQSLGLSDRVTFAGHVNNVSMFYAMADVLANPSHTEGSPYVLLEAMAAGLPIVATAVGGVPEILEDNQTALLVPARDPATMARALALALSDGQLASRLADQAAELARTRHSPENYARSLIELYSEIQSRE